MKCIDEWVVKRAAKLKKATDDKAKAEKEVAQLKADAFINIRRDAKAEIMKNLEKIEERMKKVQLHIAVGDRVILNQYDIDLGLGYSYGANSWDGGPRAYLNNLNSKGKITSPVFVKITNIIVDYSYAQEQIDKYIDNHYWINYREILANGSLFGNYYAWFKNYGTDRSGLRWADTLGLYFTAYFEVENPEFVPTWGLNIGCFIKDTSEEGSITADVWQEELDITNQLAELDEKRKILAERKTFINEKYNKIHIVRR